MTKREVFERIELIKTFVVINFRKNFREKNSRLDSKIEIRILRIFTKQINPTSPGSWLIKGAEVSTLGKDSSVPLMYNDLSDLGLIRLVILQSKLRFSSKEQHLYIYAIFK